MEATFEAGTLSGVEIEPNNNSNLAQNIFSNQPISGSLSSKDDEDWYKLSITDLSVLDIAFQSEIYSNTNWQILLLDESMNLINSMTCGGSTCHSDGSIMSTNILGSGIRYIKVVSSSVYSYPSGSYYLSFSSSILPDLPETPKNLAASSGVSQESISISWDKGQSGDEYILFRSTVSNDGYQAITRTFLNSYVDSSVSIGYDYFYKVQAINMRGESEVSTPIIGKLADGPMPIVDLVIVDVSPETIDLNFTAPFLLENSSDVSQYEIRYSEYEINQSNWNLATKFNGYIEPGHSGSSQNLQISGLKPETKYWFAVKSFDQNNFVSQISNVTSSTTLPIISISQTSFNLMLGDGQTEDKKITITNLSSSKTISYSTSISGVGTLMESSSNLSSKTNPTLQSKPSASMGKLPNIIPKDVKEWIVKINENITSYERQEFIDYMTKMGAYLIKNYDAYDMQLWSLPVEDTSKFTKILTFLNNDNRVEYAEPSYPIASHSLPNDQYMSSLWGLKNTGQSGTGSFYDESTEVGLVGADIDIERAWEITQGSPEVIVAVFDTGIDFEHSDLAANLWTNLDEIPGNGIDDDGNGYIDDIHGWNYCWSDNDVWDDDGHGTHVSGTIAANIGNDVGIVGVAPKVKIMTIKILGGQAGCPDDSNIAIQRAIQYAVDNGASVMNHSWGCAYPGTDYCQNSRTINDGIRYAKDRGVLFVQASGNNSLNNDNVRSDFWDRNIDNIISVAATNRQDKIAEFSNYGLSTVDLGAPGVGILSTTPNNNYESYSGTSMASPHVAGAAALIKSYRPSWDYSKIKNLLLEKADPLSDLRERTLSGGRLNVGEALASILPRWIIVNANEQATLAPGESVEISFQVIASGLSDGLHNGSIALEFNGTASFTKDITITLNKGITFQSSTSSAVEFFQEPRGLIVISDFNAPSIEISWDEVSGSISYQVERATSLDGTYEIVSTVTNNNYIDSNATAEQTYFYRVRSNFTNGSSAASLVISAKRSDLTTDLSITSSISDSGTYLVENNIVIPINVENKGIHTVTQALLHYSIPEGMDHVSGEFEGGVCTKLDQSYSCDLGEISASNSKNVTITVKPTLVRDNILLFRSSGSIDDPRDIDASNNTLVLTTTINRNYDLSISTFVDQSDSKKGYFDIVNNGPSDSSETTVTFNYNGDNSITAISDKGSCNVANGSHVCELGIIENGEVVRIQVSQQIAEDAILDSMLVSDFDNNSENNSFALNYTGVSELDSDLDGVPNSLDAFPNNVLYSNDSDSDGMPDSWEEQFGLNPYDPLDATSDQDNDGTGALQEFILGTIPSHDDTEDQFSWDFDKDGNADALTDGLLLLRYTFNLRGATLTAGAISSSSLLSPDEVEANVAEATNGLADIDGNGAVDALTDGLMLLRYLFNLRGDSLIGGAVKNDATRTSAADIENYIQSLIP
jgi:subtilisin family serine protease